MKQISRRNLMLLIEARDLLDLIYSTEEEELPLDLEIALLDGASNLENVISHYKGEQ